jgi:hypothetical protein
MYDDVEAISREPQGNGTPDAATRSGDENGAAHHAHNRESVSSR